VAEHGEVVLGALDQRLEAADLFRPFEGVDIVLNTEHRWRVDGLALEDAFVELAALGHAEDLRQRPGRAVDLGPGERARAEYERARCSLTAPHLLPGVGDQA